MTNATRPRIGPRKSKKDETLIYRSGRIREAVKFSGHSQIDLLLSIDLLTALGNPPSVSVVFHATSDTVRLRGVWEGGYKIRRTAWSRIISSIEVARLLYRLDPQGRYFDASVVGEREVAIGRSDIIAQYSYHRFTPGDPFLSPSQNRLAGEEYDRTGVLPKPQYQSEIAPAPGEWPANAEPQTVPNTVQTVPQQAPTNDNMSTETGVPFPNDPRFGLPFPSFKDYSNWRREHKDTPKIEGEDAYLRAYAAYRRGLEGVS